MSTIAIEIIKIGSVAYISQKALKVIGEKDMAGIIAFCGWCGIGANICSLFILMYNSIMDSALVKLLEKIF